MSRFDSYIICTSPRSGSTLLCHLLRDTGVAGHPGSHFHKPLLDAWLSTYDLKREEFETDVDATRATVAAGFAHGKGGTEVFGLRLQRHSFDFFADSLRLLRPDLTDTKSRMIAEFGETLFIHLTRANKLDQAISYVIAQQSGLWHRAPDGSEIERLSAPAEPVYDADAIATQLREFQDMEAAWHRWFAEDAITPMTIGYDDLSRDPFGIRDKVLRALGLELPETRSAEVPVAKLSGGINQTWEEQFRSDHPELLIDT